MELAIQRGFAAVNPIPDTKAKRGGWRWEPVSEKEMRTLTGEEEQLLADAAEKLYGLKWSVFVKVALATGGRRSELFGLA